MKPNHRYAHISSLKALRQEETKLHYQSLLAEKSMALKVMELRYEFDPQRWASLIGDKLFWFMTRFFD
ncbi:hypothetical protein LX69_02488 [Breznakibacter xylanolyticus]|uniref:Uncharacterized protein n=1 Tax=Breznakibacter xylanolyticus TaxID=990 RepID=A0A2W7N158_9BACT|nr:hypothetical protein [Breznakibacter xylanolyticus]MBN2743021.1 hypothetical protein [Marinilabiliaceae bacterium]PZX13810.1 hypothetical protein LX69_02488 [Breznakibacter xylanolyticus]